MNTTARLHRDNIQNDDIIITLYYFMFDIVETAEAVERSRSRSSSTKFDGDRWDLFAALRSVDKLGIIFLFQ